MQDHDKPENRNTGTTASILLVEDEILSQQMYAQTLRSARYDVKAVGSVKEMEAQLRQRPFDLLVVDMGLPDGDGLAAARELVRETMPVIGITINDSIDVRVAALEELAIDFLVKPFDERELVVRVRNALRPVLLPHSEERISFAGFTYHPTSGELYGTESQPIALGSADQRLLYALVMNRGRPLSREWLATELLGRWSDADQRIIDVQISRLRKKLAPDGNRIIRTVRHVGYQFIAELLTQSAS